MSDRDQPGRQPRSPSAGDPPGFKKLNENNLSLKKGLARPPLLNRKMLRGIMAVGGVTVMFGVIVGLSSHPQKTAKQAAQSKPDIQQDIPNDLNVGAGDYAPIRPQQPPALAEEKGPRSVSQQNTGVPSYAGILPSSAGVPSYNSYPRTQPTNTSVQFVPPQQPPQGPLGSQPPAGQASNGQPSSQNPPWPSSLLAIGNPNEAENRRLAALKSTFFFPWTSDQQDNQTAQNQSNGKQTPQVNGQITDAQATALQAAYDDAATKQNMAKEKQAFMLHQSGDWSAYLDNHYITPIDAQHLLQAGSYMPITMVTGINSDVPGSIVAQVNENVYDSLYGNNILIPRGSRLLGTYDSTISFGQNRVMVAWERLIRTDGISISLRGMKGADLQGQSGLHDQVDYHIAQILAVVGASTLFNVGTNVAISAMSTSTFLSSLAAAMTAQGTTSNNVTAAANQVAVDYATKIINQSPTIVIREGTRAYCVIDHDMILPAYVDQDGGYQVGE